MLARLDQIPGVASARVDASGRYFWLSLAPGATTGRLLARVRAVLGDRAFRLPPSRARAQVAPHARGDPWYGAAQVAALSFVEMRILAARIATDAALAIGADGAARERIGDAVRHELFAAMERVHAGGGRPGTGWVHDEWPAASAAAARACAAGLPRTRARLLARVLPGLLAR